MSGDPGRAWKAYNLMVAQKYLGTVEYGCSTHYFPRPYSGINECAQGTKHQAQEHMQLG